MTDSERHFELMKAAMGEMIFGDDFDSLAIKCANAAAAALDEWKRRWPNKDVNSERDCVKHIIDLDAAPFIPDGWKVESHKKGGSFEWDPAKVALHLEPEQIAGRSLKGTELQKRLEGKSAFNANMLDWLLAHTEAIPESWKQDENGKSNYIFFFGTIYRRSDGYLCVRCLCWGDGGWDWGCFCLGFGFGVQYPSAVCAS